jgi:hypothetical protein
MKKGLASVMPFHGSIGDGSGWNLIYLFPTHQEERLLSFRPQDIGLSEPNELLNSKT